MNSILISGRIANEPRYRLTSNGKSVANFAVATQRPNVKETTDFIECVAWEKTADFICQNFHKGKWIEISGVLTTRDFEKDGEKRKITEVRCDIVGFGGAKKCDCDIPRKDPEQEAEETNGETKETAA